MGQYMVRALSLVLAIASVSLYASSVPPGDYFPLKPGCHWIYEGESSSRSRFNGAMKFKFQREITISNSEKRGDTTFYSELIKDSVYNKIHTGYLGGDTALQDQVNKYEFYILQVNSEKPHLQPKDSSNYIPDFFLAMFSHDGDDSIVYYTIFFKSYLDTLNENQVQVYWEGSATSQITRLENVGIWTYSFDSGTSTGPFNENTEKDSLIDFSILPPISILPGKKHLTNQTKVQNEENKIFDVLGRCLSRSVSGSILHVQNYKRLSN